MSSFVGIHTLENTKFCTIHRTRKHFMVDDHEQNIHERYSPFVTCPFFNSIRASCGYRLNIRELADPF